MKKALIIISLFFSLGNTSCNYLDVVPDDIPTLDAAFADRYIAETYLGTCYWHIPRLAGWNENPALGGSLEAWFPTEGPHFANSIYIGRGLQTVTDPQCNYWSGGRGGKNLYAGIRDCNIFLEKIEGVRDLNPREKRRWIAEVKFLKAYYHFYLLRMYGPIHIIEKNVPVYEPTEKMRMYREPIDACFNYIFTLMDEAIAEEALPSTIVNVQAELGRVTKPVVLAMKAKMMVYYASPLFNGNTEYANFKNYKGEHFFNQTFDATRWTDAAEACQVAIEACHSAGVKLYQKSDFQSQFEIRDEILEHIALRNSVSDRWNCELIWGLSTHVMDWGFQQAVQPRFSASEQKPAKSYYAAPIHVAELFYSKHGVPISQDKTMSGVDLFALRTVTADDALYLGVGEQTAVINFDREPRYYSSLGFDRGKWFGEVNVADPSTTPVVKARYGEPASVANPGEYSATGYWPKKLVNLKSNFKDANTYNAETYPFPAMRLADLYLLYAEALCESGASLGSVYPWIDAVRERAGLKGVVDSWRDYSTNSTLPTTRPGLLSIIRQERQIELACEGSQYWDLRRWKTAQSQLNRNVRGWNVLTSSVNEYYTLTTLGRQSFTLRDYFSPIPEKEIINNPKLEQNPGW